jgi:methionyl aminopeptidase
MEDETALGLEEMKEAGKLTANLKKDAEQLVMVGESLLDIAETLEQYTVKQGAAPAFPVNISINEIAAHYTPTANDKSEIPEDGLVKVDFGVIMENAITDTSVTIDLGNKYGALMKASKDALENAIKAIKPGVQVNDISKIIHETIRENGCKPISNLTGHKIEWMNIHAGIEIPSIPAGETYEFQEGDVFAVEPFVTTKEGAGYIKETDKVEIYSLFMPGNIRMRQTRKMLEYIINSYKTMPFCERWLSKEFSSRLVLNAGLREMMKARVLVAYPVLAEAKGQPIAQFEDTVVVTGDGCVAVTKG